MEKRENNVTEAARAESYGKRSEGKEANLAYYLRGYARLLIPRPLRRLQRRLLLRGWEKRPDADYIRERVDYYCQLPAGSAVGEGSRTVASIKSGNMGSRYFIDFTRYLRSFPKNLRLYLQTQDVWENPRVPTLMKARRLDELTPNGVLLKLDKRRHFRQPVDPVPFEAKKPVLFFRGEIDGKPNRIKFFEMWADNPLFDLGDTTRKNRSRWFSEMVSLTKHFDYRYILTLEGNDVATAVQWVMASNCVAVMPRPTVEAWLMHARLIPGVHYIEISPDFSDVGEKLQYYTDHPEEAARIARASTEWAQQFFDRKRENIISYLVIEKYFRQTGQKLSGW